jgi:hypothetical protein
MNQPKQGIVNAHADWMTRGLDTVTGEARLSEEINVIRESLDSAAVSDRKRMPERIFVGLWLPFFYEGQNRFYPELSFGMWSAYAGNDYREVDVINHKGEVLFTVPPRFDRAGIRSLLKERTRMPGGNIINVIKNAEMKSRVSPRDGSMYLQTHLKQRAMIMGNIPPSVKTNIDRWNAIFTRYGLKAVTESEEVTHEPNALSTPSTNQVTSNDDWELL